MKMITVQRTEFLTTVPKFSRKELERVVYQHVTNQTDVWCLKTILQILPFLGDPFQVSFRKPAEYGLEKRSFIRVCDFISALGGEEIGLWNTVALYVHLTRQESLEFNGNIMNQFENVGRHYFRLGIYISKGIPYLVSEHGGCVSFNPEMYYGVSVK